MSFDTLSATLAFPIGPGGSITFAYPSGRSADSYSRNGAVLTDANGAVARQEAEMFSVLYGPSSVKVVYGAGPTVAAGSVALKVPLSIEADVLSGGSSSSTSVVSFGADTTGVASAEQAFRSAVATGAHVYVPAGTFNLKSVTETIPLAAGQFLYGEGTILVSGAVSNGGGVFTLSTRCRIYGLTFAMDSSFSGKVFYTDAHQNHIRIEGNAFESVSTFGTSIYLEQIPRKMTIRNNRQTGGASFLLAVGPHECRIAGNTIEGASQSILCYGGSGNTVTGNVIDGGVSGILFLSFRQIGSNNLMRGNTVSANVVKNVSEEAISFDCAGNSPTTWPENGTQPILTVTSATNGASLTTVNFSETASLHFATSYVAVVLTGTAAGHVALIEASTASSIQLPRSSGNIQAKLSAGDKILVTTGAIQNTIVGNIAQGGTAGISLWGSAWHNVIDGNQTIDCYEGIAISSVVQKNASGNAGVQAWSGFNTITNNMTSTYKGGSDETGTGVGIRLTTAIFGSGVFALTANRNPGNEVRGNHAIGKGFQIDDQTVPILRDNRTTGGALAGVGNTGVIDSSNYVGTTLTTFTLT